MNHVYHAREYIEQFHLLLLNQLSQKLDKGLYALKGGCNLRFYFNSIRYSEDLDIDIHTIHQATLHNKIDALIARTATQARDIFDLYLLLQTNIPPDTASNNTPTQLLQAKEHALSITFSDFKSQTLAYLTPDYQKQYDSQEVWGHILSTVVNALEPKPS